MARCGYCQNEVDEHSLVCRHCGVSRTRLGRWAWFLADDRVVAWTTAGLLAWGGATALLWVPRRNLEELLLVSTATVSLTAGAFLLMHFLRAIRRLMVGQRGEEVGRVRLGGREGTASLNSGGLWLSVIVLMGAGLAVGTSVVTLLNNDTMVEFGGEAGDVFNRRDLWVSGFEAPEVVLEEVETLGLSERAQVVVGEYDSRMLSFRSEELGHYVISAVGVRGFDSFLYLFRVEETNTLVLVDWDDDGGENTDALIMGELTEAEYVVVVEGFAGDGGVCWVTVDRQ